MWRNKSKGGWRCRVKAYRRHYPISRRWWLGRQRKEILSKLDLLKQEAEALDS